MAAPDARPSPPRGGASGPVRGLDGSGNLVVKHQRELQSREVLVRGGRGRTGIVVRHFIFFG